ncbi:MAG: signal peptidase I [Firmicutes bacterium HGW-Firmicutes-16]|nr:MAG: signal peptidase I [Firmicutes bacterium HGW-Firmicutes-16]
MNIGKSHRNKYEVIKGGAEIIRRVEKYHYITIVVMLFILFVLENTQLLGINDFFNYYPLYFLKIAMWIALGVLIKIFPSAMFSGLIRLREVVISLAFIFGVFQLLIFVIIGFFTSFGKNVYSLTPVGITLNLVPMCATLVGGEMCRSFLINSLSGKKPYRAIICFSVLFALFNMSLGNVKSLSGSLSILDYMNGMVFPQLTQSIAASLLVYLAGPVPSIIYLGIIRTFSFLSPYIPNPSEIPRLLFNVLVPLLSVSIILKIYAKEASEFERSTQSKTGVFGWVTVCVLSVAMVWFSVGVFPIFPSVVLTGSMEPKIMPGDIVLVEKISGERVNVGDVVMYYSEDDINITHRIIEKNNESGVIQYVLKGDNNPSADQKSVSTEQIKGRVIGTIPELGKLTLYLRNSGS